MSATRVFGLAAIVAAVPTIVWRVVVGAGPTLGTPASWRASEDIPGSGTGYVVGLSVAELIAALLTLVLIVPGADRLPRALGGARFPRWLVVGAAGVGTAALAVICVLSIVNWHNVDPFADAPVFDGWAALCWGCYAAALGWPLFLVPTIVGYARSRVTASPAAARTGATG